MPIQSVRPRNKSLGGLVSPPKNVPRRFDDAATANEATIDGVGLANRARIARPFSPARHPSFDDIEPREPGSRANRPFDRRPLRGSLTALVDRGLH